MPAAVGTAVGVTEPGARSLIHGTAPRGAALSRMFWSCRRIRRQPSFAHRKRLGDRLASTRQDQLGVQTTSITIAQSQLTSMGPCDIPRDAKSEAGAPGVS